MDNKFTLQFKDKTITRLAGYTYGKRIFDDQVKNKIQYNKKIIIVFPIQIERIASSFVQGFFEEIIESIGRSELQDRVIIEATEKVKSDIEESL